LLTKLGLPKAISGHENYSLWGPRDYTGEKIIAVGFSKEDGDASCGSVDVAAVDKYGNPQLAYVGAFSDRHSGHIKWTFSFAEQRFGLVLNVGRCPPMRLLITEIQ
jgi:hypothetical protein